MKHLSIHCITHSYIVSASSCRTIPGRIQGLFPRRYVLFSDICHGGNMPSKILALSDTDRFQNIELFFCLYANDWNNPGHCNSTHSRLLGFFTTLPGIWRAFQCLRRYYDTRNAFPHLVNCGKYTFTILFYMTLSLYRIDKNDSLRALFITCATVNSVYTCRSPMRPLRNLQTNMIQRFGMLLWIGVRTMYYLFLRNHC